MQPTDPQPYQDLVAGLGAIVFLLPLSAVGATICGIVGGVTHGVRSKGGSATNAVFQALVWATFGALVFPLLAGLVWFGLQAAGALAQR